MPYAMVSSSFDLEYDKPRECAANLLAHICDDLNTRLEDAKVLVVMDAMVDFESCYRGSRCRAIRDAFQKMGVYNLNYVWAFWPARQTPPPVMMVKTRRLTEKDLVDSTAVMIVGGNGFSILQAFARAPDLLRLLRERIQEDKLCLFSWSAGSTSSGKRFDHSNDFQSDMRHRTSSDSTALTPLKLLGPFSFAVHCKGQHVEWWRKYIKKQKFNSSSSRTCLDENRLVLLKDGCSALFMKSPAVYCTLCRDDARKSKQLRFLKHVWWAFSSWPKPQ